MRYKNRIVDVWGLGREIISQLSVVFLFGSLWLGSGSLVAKSSWTEKELEKEFHRVFDGVIYSSPRISPDGKTIALLAPDEDGETGLIFYDLENWVKKDYKGAVSGGRPSGDLEIGGFRWIDNDHVICPIGVNNEASAGNVIFRKDGRQLKAFRHSKDILMFPDDTLDHREGEFMMVAFADGDQDEWEEHHLLKVKLMDRRKGFLMEASYENPGDVGEWFVDAEGVPWMIHAPKTNQYLEVEVRKSEKSRIFQEYFSYSRSAKPTRYEIVPESRKPVTWEGEFMGSLPGNKFLLIKQRSDEGFEKILVYNRESEKVIKTFEEEGFDVGDISGVYGPDGTAVGIRYFTDRYEYGWLSSQLDELDDLVDQLLPERWNQIFGFVLGGDYLLLNSSSPEDPGVCLLLNLATHELTPIYFKKDPKSIDPFHGVEERFFINRSGDRIQSYLTMPNGHPKGARVPVLALTHGGPWVRDFPFYDEEAQFFASLGYAVLQVNYRGSSGYGLEYELGEDLLDIAEASPLDVIDGVKDLIDEGIADPDKVVFMGASFGAFISMAVTGIEPDLPTATVAFAGLYDINEMIRRDEDKNRMFIHLDVFDSQKDDPGRAMRASPVSMAGTMTAPILLVHGGNDQRVGLEQVNEMASALRRAGHKDFKTIRDSHLLHGFGNLKQKRSYYLRIAEFLSEKVGVPVIK